ncbi:MAG TPA: HK97 gp10 family phage protein [Clostridia bacterium]|nr:HK97 gp10 family phage protein [Clostridia bacterium]
MSMEIKGSVELREDISRMADLLRTSGENGSRACNWILQNAARPVLEQMLQNASTDPKPRSGKLRNSIKIGRVVRKRKGGYRVTVGVHRSDGGAEYANPLEFGHGGPHPAPPHPFVRPAFDARVDEAYEKVKEQLRTALDHRGLL